MTVLAWVAVGLVASFACGMLLSLVGAVSRVAAATERLASCAEAQNLYYGLRPQPGEEEDLPAAYTEGGY